MSTGLPIFIQDSMPNNFSQLRYQSGYLASLYAEEFADGDEGPPDADHNA